MRSRPLPPDDGEQSYDREPGAKPFPNAELAFMGLALGSRKERSIIPATTLSISTVPGIIPLFLSTSPAALIVRSCAVPTTELRRSVRSNCRAATASSIFAAATSAAHLVRMLCCV